MERKMKQDGPHTAIVTGASSGIGAEYAKVLAAGGNNLILVSNQQEQQIEIAQKLASQFGMDYITELGTGKGSQWVIALYKDLAKESAAAELFDMCKESRTEVDIIINNAGIFFFKDIAECSPQRISTILTLHIYTATMLCRLFGEEMARRKKGYILNMSSVCVFTPFSGISLYSATKSYIRNMSFAFRLEMKEHGVNVLTVTPGAVATNLYNLPANLQQLGVRLGVIYKPDKLARKAIKSLFSGKKEYVPGAINHLFKPIYAMLPLKFKLWARKKTEPLRK